MLSRKNRLDLRREFLNLKEKGELVPHPFFGLLCLRTKKNSEPQFAFLISTKVSKKAVSRNKLKRKLSGVVEKKLSRVCSGTEAVFLLKGKALEANSAQLAQAIDDTFLKARVLKEK